MFTTVTTQRVKVLYTQRKTKSLLVNTVHITHRKTDTNKIVHSDLQEIL